MCGIVGIAGSSGRPVDDAVVRSMNDALWHRGPDDEGYLVRDQVGLGMRRLSIIDVAGGRQPIHNEDKSVWAVFNGEIYNYDELRDELQRLGHQFYTKSDTETLVHLYEEYGDAGVARLRGMFAYALWDERRNRLVIARDRLGIKPLYYARIDGRLFFASELKAFLRVPGFPRDLDGASLQRYLAYLYVPGPATIFRNVVELPPAHYLVCEGDRITEHRYWSIRYEGQRQWAAPEWRDRFLSQFRASVKSHLMSEVPLGAFLSGGVDSSAVVASMARQSARPVVTTSVGFAERSHSELEHARAVAEALGTEHHALVVKPDAMADLPRLVWHLDQPFADSSALPTYYVSRAARERVTVALSGDGGDELFAGYQRRYGIHRLEQRLRRLIPGPVRRGVLAPLARLYPRSDRIPRPLRLKLVLSNLGQSFERAYFNDMSLFLDEEKRALCTPEFLAQVRHHDSFAGFTRHFDRVRDADPLSRVLYVDFKTWLANDILVKVDRMSMACSLEVRSPLLDHKIIEFAASLPPALKFRGSVSKFLLKQHVASRLPAIPVHRPKQGFELPLTSWFRGELKDMTRDLLFSTRAAGRGYVRPEAVKRLWDDHQRGYRSHASQIWALMVLELWHRQYVDTP